MICEMIYDNNLPLPSIRRCYTIGMTAPSKAMLYEKM